MSPYRSPDEDAQQRAKQEEEKQKRRAELSMFGVRQMPDGSWRPILEREETNPCRDCRGYGTGGNPLCGAVYTCKRCEGSGVDPEPATLPPPESKPEPMFETKPSFWQRLVNWWNE